MVAKGGGVAKTTGIRKNEHVSEEQRSEREETLYSAKERDEWDALLARSKLWRTF